VKNRWVDLECNKEHGATTRKKGVERRCSAGDLDLRWGAELYRFKNEEGRREEGEKGHARMILREGGRGASMRGGEEPVPHRQWFQNWLKLANFLPIKWGC
jgi:hypothetical protein